LPWGSHICVFYSNRDELADIFIAYFKAGLENNEYCIWITPDDPCEKFDKADIDHVTSAFTTSLEKDQMEVVPQDEIYFKNGVFNYHKAFTIMSVKYVNALNKGYKGIRIGGCTPWLKNEMWLDLVTYEADENKEIDKSNTIALCTYPIYKCNPREIIDVLNIHKYILNASDSRFVFLGDRQPEPTAKADGKTEESSNLVIQKLREELEESEELFHKTANASPDIISISTFYEGKFIFINDNFLHFYGLTRNKVIDHTFDELNLDVNINSREILVKRLKRKGRIKNGESTHRLKSGEIRKTKFSSVLHNIDGQPCIITVITDITERKKMEEEERVIISTAMDGFWINDTDGKFLEVNDSYCQMIGYTRDELFEMSISDVEAIESPKEIANRISKIKRVGSDRFRTQHRRKDGGIIDLEINISFYNVGKGQFFVFIHDLSREKEARERGEARLQASWRKNTTRLQERFIKEGFKDFEDREIIELLLSLVLPARQAKRLAIKCVEKFKNLSVFLEASPQELIQVGLTPACVFCIAMLHNLPTRVLQEKIKEKSIYESPQDVFDYLYYSMRDLKKEVFKVIYLDSRDQIISTSDLFKGTLDKININAREVVEFAVTNNAKSLIFAHNHPSGDPTPSQTDKQLTRDLVFIGSILQIRVLDHIIIGDNRYYSFAAEGLIKEYETDFLNLKITGTSEAKRKLSKARLPFINGIISCLLN
jgi:DNA repair protein RadC